MHRVDSVIIRLFEEKDAKELNTLISEILSCVYVTEQNSKTIAQMMNEYRAKTLITRSKTEKIFLVQIDNELAGVLFLDNNKIKRTFIKTSHRGKRIGSKLLEYVENFARKQKIKKLNAVASPATLNFYLSKGYEKTKDFSENGFKKMLVEKKL